MQKRLASSFENRDPRSLSSRRRSLRRVGALALLLCAYGMSAGGCSRQAEGERCDHTANGDEDCDDGLECVRPRGSAVDRCCPPAGAPIDDSRCNGSDAPIATGGTAGSSNETGGASTTGGLSSEGGTTGGTDATAGAGSEAAGAGGEDTSSGGSSTGGSSTGGVVEPEGGSGGVPAAGAGNSGGDEEPATGGTEG